MRIQVIIEPDIKRAAEAAARRMGYSSLASLLRVLSNNLAREAARNQEEVPLPLRSTPPPKSLEPVIVRQPTLPAPEQFTVWPQYVSRSLWQTDPELYLFYIEAGIIR
ncbi:MAG TPA: hypothetical protein VMR98_00910 [Candidatus Polarisedimenticolaceae bacterium]|nr:hypothetical protein [Candidatus Polarisedimenticolaceae bacterium]